MNKSCVFDLLDFAKAREGKRIYILGYSERCLKIQKILRDNGVLISGFIEIKGNNRTKKDVYSLTELSDIESKEISLIIGVRYRHFNEVVPQIVNAGINDLYFLNAYDIDNLENDNSVFEFGQDMSVVYLSRHVAFDSAYTILKMIDNIIPIHSVIDFGCGSGAYLAAAQGLRENVQIKGLDICDLDRSEFVPNDAVDIVNFENYIYNSEKKYDIAISIEVAEHIDEEFSDIFVENLCRSSDMVLFSAAIRYQRGDGHVNCQYPSYWARKFTEHGFIGVDFIRSKIWDDKRIMLHCRQNIVLYISKNSKNISLFDKYLELTPMNIVHPEFLEGVMSSIYEGNY